MNTTFREENQNYVMTFEGRLDTPSSFMVGRDMQVLYDCEGHDIILDCTALTYIASSGMRLFLDLLKVARSKGSKCTMRFAKCSTRSDSLICLIYAKNHDRKGNQTDTGRERAAQG